MTMDGCRDHPMNRRLIEYLTTGSGSPGAECALPSDFEDPYRWLGSHPDVVERLWDQLGGALGADCNRVVYSRPALVCPASGLVLALAMGTTYALRIHARDQPEAVELGFVQEYTYSTSPEPLRLKEICGSDWYFGCYHDREVAWCRRSLFRSE